MLRRGGGCALQFVKRNSHSVKFSTLRAIANYIPFVPYEKIPPTEYLSHAELNRFKKIPRFEENHPAVIEQYEKTLSLCGVGTHRVSGLYILARTGVVIGCCAYWHTYLMECFVLLDFYIPLGYLCASSIRHATEVHHNNHVEQLNSLKIFYREELSRLEDGEKKQFENKKE